VVAVARKSWTDEKGSLTGIAADLRWVTASCEAEMWKWVYAHGCETGNKAYRQLLSIKQRWLLFSVDAFRSARLSESQCELSPFTLTFCDPHSIDLYRLNLLLHRPLQMSDFEDDDMDVDPPVLKDEIKFSSDNVNTKGKRNAANLPVEAEDTLPWYPHSRPLKKARTNIGQGREVSAEHP
jgi:hypothetical protein